MSVGEPRKLIRERGKYTALSSLRLSTMGNVQTDLISSLEKRTKDKDLN